jgi:hypothetical protein
MGEDHDIPQGEQRQVNGLARNQIFFGHVTTFSEVVLPDGDNNRYFKTSQIGHPGGRMYPPGRENLLGA